MFKTSDLKIKIFADGAKLEDMLKAYKEGWVSGFTTNPTLMKQAGVTDYKAFAREVLSKITDLPVSFEVFSDDFEDMEIQARKIAGWGKNVNVKIPVTNTRGESSIPLIKKLSGSGISLNITAIMTIEQVEEVAKAINPGIKNIISIFAGRIADTGRDPVPMMKRAVEICRGNTNAHILWASPRELLNIIQAEEAGCHIITVAPDILKKLPLIGKDLGEYSLDTVKMFYSDGKSQGFRIE
ncbi:MAG: transaldolase [Brevinematales bacterium]